MIILDEYLVGLYLILLQSLMEYTETSYGSMSQMSTFFLPLMPSTGKNNGDYDAESSIDILLALTLYRSSFYSMAMLARLSKAAVCYGVSMSVRFGLLEFI